MGQTKRHFLWETEGSITVFLTLLFGTVLAVVTATFENVRFLTADSYMMAAAEAAAVSVFGGYNLELYQEYGFFGYGGYEGHGVSDLTDSVLETLAKNLQSRPEEENGVKHSGDPGGYTSLYRMQNVSLELREIETLTDKEIFYQQVEAYLATQMVSDMTKEVTGLYHAIVQAGDQKSIEENLNTTSEYEQGAYDAAEGKENPSGGGNADRENTGEKNTATGNRGDAGQNADSVSEQAGGNPLETFRTVLRDGILNLVCDADSLSEESVEAVYAKQTQAEGRKAQKEDSTANLLKDLLKDEEGLMDGSFLEATKEKGELICYAQKVFSRYDHLQKKTFQYGVEYLVGGAEQERDNLLQVVNRLLLVRTALNYAYVRTDSSLQAASLTTAAEIAGALEIPPLISAIQQTILLILSVEESCIDITALLEGKAVPLYKDAVSFQMKYSEICSAGKALFQAKAKNYKAKKENGAGITLCYEQYLWIFLLAVPEKTLRLRTCDLIQNDLQRRYHATFSLEHCTAGMQYQIDYEMPFVWGGFFLKGQEAGMVRMQIVGSHRYQ